MKQLSCFDATSFGHLFRDRKKAGRPVFWAACFLCRELHPEFCLLCFNGKASLSPHAGTCPQCADSNKCPSGRLGNGSERKLCDQAKTVSLIPDSRIATVELRVHPRSRIVQSALSVKVRS